MRKIILIYIFAVLLFVDAYGQVGINTEKPTSALDVNGNALITKDLQVGGSKNTQGSAGTDGQFLISKGAGKAPEWQTVPIATPDTGDWYLITSISRTDTKDGLRYAEKDQTGAKAYDNTYQVTQSALATNGEWTVTGQEGYWDEFKDFTLELDKVDAPLRVVINVQFLAQAFWEVTDIPGSPWMSYAVGVFQDVSTGTSLKTAKMLGSRQGNATGTNFAGGNTPQELMTFVMVIDLPANTESKLYIMGTQRSNSIYGSATQRANYHLALGRLMDNTPVDEDDSILRRATMRADIYKLKK